MEVEIYTNLVHVTPAMWETFQLPGVRLATSYYSDQPGEHRSITGRPTLKITTRNIARAQDLGIPLRVGVIGVVDGQRTQHGAAVLERLGVSEIGYNDLREVGRGIRQDGPSTAQLCGNCGDQQVAISPTGEVWPCVFSRWLPAGNVREKPLMEILTSETFVRITGELREEFGERMAKPCGPDPCSPDCSPSCKPAGNCRPFGNCAPNYLCGPCAPKDRNCNPVMSCNPNKCRPEK